MESKVTGLLGTPLRTLAAVVAFELAVTTISTIGYIAAGWRFEDAVYMVVLTIFSVGYGEVHPIDTAALHILTMSTMVFGCTGMIVLTGALVQVFTAGQIRQLLGQDQMLHDIDHLKDHVIICGFGRIGLMLAKDLKEGGARLVVLEKDETRAALVREQGYLCLAADAADEEGLKSAGIERARVLATVLPDDAANVFITLTAERLNPRLQIIARGEQASTESKLLYAGADKVVLPTHIGAERIAEMILFPETARFIRGSDRMRDFEKTLRDLGLQLEVSTVAPGSSAAGQTVGDIERRAKGGLFIVQLDRGEHEHITRPPPDIRLQAGDGVLIVTRFGDMSGSTIFHTAAAKVRSGRSLF